MKYFTIEELERSETAKSKGIDNTGTAETRFNLKQLVLVLLDPIREAWGKPIKVNSGYRSPELNKAVGGSKTSHHCKGMAADITAGNREDNRKLFELIKDLCQNRGLPFTQLIDETHVKEKPYQWIHISFDPSNPKCQIMHGGYKNEKGITVYTYE